MQQIFRESAHLNILAMQAIEKQRFVHQQMCQVQRQIEVLVAIQTIKLDLHLYQFGNEYFELWAFKISDAKKREKDFQERVNRRLTAKKTRQNLVLQFFAQPAQQLDAISEESAGLDRQSLEKYSSEEAKAPT